MSYYDHATMIAYRLGPWAPAAEPPLDVPATRESSGQDPVKGPRQSAVRDWIGRLWTPIRTRLRPHRHHG